MGPDPTPRDGVVELVRGESFFSICGLTLTEALVEAGYLPEEAATGSATRRTIR